MDILFLLCLVVLFVVQIIVLISSLKNNKRKLFLITVFVEIVAMAIAAFILYYFNEVLFKYNPNFEGFFQIASAAVFIMMYFIIFVITSVSWVVKTAKNKIV